MYCAIDFFTTVNGGTVNHFHLENLWGNLRFPLDIIKISLTPVIRVFTNQHNTTKNCKHYQKPNTVIIFWTKEMRLGVHVWAALNCHYHNNAKKLNRATMTIIGLISMLVNYYYQMFLHMSIKSQGFYSNVHTTELLNTIQLITIAEKVLLLKQFGGRWGTFEARIIFHYHWPTNMIMKCT